MKNLVITFLSLLLFVSQVSAIAPDQGNFKLTFLTPESDSLKDLATAVKESGLFEEVFLALNQTIAMPRDIDVVFRECGEENAAYDAETHEIDVCYDMIARFGKIFARDKDNSIDDVGKFTLESTMFIVFHETGHALVDQLDIPVTGREEDAVDDLAGIIALHLGDGSEEILLAAIQAFADFAEEEESGSVNELAFWDEHSLNSQRVYSIACMLVGKDPVKYQELVGDDLLPTVRADRCPDEFKQKSKSWERLLNPYFKADFSNQPLPHGGANISVSLPAQPPEEISDQDSQEVTDEESNDEDSVGEVEEPDVNFSRPFQGN